ncbi:uncharacterized protein JCM6883_005783 [Sporobolomyces salmoneus]|uniref:uncharacterized protein n=1 Tax=Sporobolomyces salmoneus TaxID=183962 RepID=UPI003171DF6B
MLSTLVAVSLVGSALAQSTPLASKRFQYDNLPYQADTDTGIRGGQYGYNRCNATTETQDSRCQTAIINSVDDFCLWAPPEPGEEVGNVEGEMVAWCTKEGHGTRIIPEGALQGVQFIRTPNYVQVVGQIDQTKINIDASDYGGEMDPHGADQRGNPLGGLLFSDAFGANSSTNGTTGSGTAYQQVIQWHNFMGGGQFCLKACDPSYELGYAMCEHIFDRIGCVYNAPSSYQQINGTFQSCDGDSQLPPGQYDEGGERRTYTQPPESLGIISTIPYVPFTPASSNCVSYASSELYTAAAALATSSASSSSSAVSSSVAGSSSPSRATGSPSSTASSGNNAAASQTPASSAQKLGSVASLVGLAAAVVAWAC